LSLSFILEASIIKNEELITAYGQLQTIKEIDNAKTADLHSELNQLKSKIQEQSSIKLPA
jgi:hypothetical protein